MADRPVRNKPVLLVVTSTYPRWADDSEPGFVHELSRRLTRDYHVTVLAPHARGALSRERMEGVEIVRFRYAPVALESLVNDGGIMANLRHRPWKWLLVPPFLLMQWWMARRLIRQLHPDVIHAHWLVPQGLLATCLTRSGRDSIPLVVTAHGADLYSLRGRGFVALKRRVASASAAMTVVSSAMRDEAQREGLVPFRLEVLPMGVDLQKRFVPDAARKRSPDELLFVGRMVPKKGIRFLLAALPVVLQRRPGVRLKIVGFGPEEGSLKLLAKDLGIANEVEFAGALPQSALPDIYRHAALLVLPFVRDAAGDQEGLPVTLMEALGCGCPVVVGEVAGIRDLLGATADSVCVDPRDTRALAGKILDALDHPHEAHAQAEAIRREVAGRIDWQVIADGYSRLLASCIPDSTHMTGKA